MISQSIVLWYVARNSYLKILFCKTVRCKMSHFEVISFYSLRSVTPISMILLNSGTFGGCTSTNEPWDTLHVNNIQKYYFQSEETSLLTNVNLVNNNLRELQDVISTDSPADMPSATASGSHIPSNEDCGIRDVWAHNLEEEFRTIRQVVQKYNYVAMDTEFPGVVARPIGEFRSTADYQYQMLRCNVDLLRIIQLGLTFLDESGKTPGGSYTTWQFNFKFNLAEDMYAQDSIDLLQNSGIQFKKHEEEGIDPLDFAELLMTSGVVLMENIKWLSFHSGYDFGYLLKLLTDRNLPNEESEFFELLKLYFPTIYDVKYLMKSCKNLKGGLQEVAEQLDLERIGPQHQAGSDSLLTGMAFFKMREMFFEDNIDDSKYSGHLYGLGTSFIMNGNSFHDNGDNSSSS